MKKAHDALYQWYRNFGRHDLPWRHINDAYTIWISEIMLQQTQVKTVLERFYFPFLEAFPTLHDLASASEDEVLKKWEGLGYYTRARNLHKTAKLCQDTLPQTVSGLISLPGIGQSTAHAIASFAYKTPVPIMDANVKRILYRIFALKKASDKELWEKAHTFFDTSRPYDFNQAMMDLGAAVCMAKTALCSQCPLNILCQGVHNPLAYPEKKAKNKIPVRFRHIVIHRYRGKLALRQRETRFLNGLWGFSEYENEDELSAAQVLGKISHTYSHFKLEAQVYLHDHKIPEHEWFSLAQIKNIALSTADHKALALLNMSKE